MGKPVIHFEIIGNDPKALKTYYSALFGWEITETGHPIEYGTIAREQNVSPEGVGIGGGIGGSPDGYGGHVTIYVHTDDVEATLAKAEELGGARMMGPHRVDDQVEIGLFTDPEGHVVGVAKPL